MTMTIDNNTIVTPSNASSDILAWDVRDRRSTASIEDDRHGLLTCLLYRVYDSIPLIFAGYESGEIMIYDKRQARYDISPYV